MSSGTAGGLDHNHQFLGTSHERNERRAWFVIALCGAMMLLEIVGGLAFGSIALVADGLHMSTHAGALTLAAFAYTFARRHADDPRFSFGTGKVGDLAGFTSAIILAMIALLIGYEAVRRLIAPVPIHFHEAIPIAALGLGVNLLSAWLLGAGHDHHHGHGAHAHPEEEAHHLAMRDGRAVELSIHEAGSPPRFRLNADPPVGFPLATVSLETVRPDGRRQSFLMADRGGYLESLEEIPEPHAFTAHLRVGGEIHVLTFEEHHHADAHDRDHNMRAAVVHVLADAAVSVLVITGLVAAQLFGWLWMDPLAGLLGAGVIASWSVGLIRDTGAVLLDMNPDRKLSNVIRRRVEAEGDLVSDLHLWRLGPGHLGAIVGVVTATDRQSAFYRAKLGGLAALSHVTVEVTRLAR